MSICPICKQNTASKYKSDVKSVYSSKAYDIRHCSNCKHFFTDPLPSDKELDDIYANKYSYDAHSMIESEKRTRAKNYANYIAKISGTKTALEVGCMHGLLLTELERNGLKASGIELDPEAVKYCREHGLDVTQGSIENYLKKADSKYDVIIMSHVIEHIVNPEQQLRSLYKQMPKDGRLVLITPNSMARTRQMFGRFWGYWQVPVHINHFNKTSMAELLKNSGFKVEETKYYGADSLFFLSSLANLLGARNDTKSLSSAKKLLVKVAARVLWPWYHFGREDMVVVAAKA